MEHLLLISLECRGVALVMRAIWATTEDRLTGRRRTDTELLVDAPTLLQRLAELVPQLAPPAAAVQGVAAMVSATDLALAAGGGRRAA